MPSLMRRQTFVRERYPTINDHGNTTTDYTATPTEATFYGSIQPGAGTEDVVNRNGAEIVKTIWCPDPHVDVVDNDRVRLADGVYQVNGEPERWQTGVRDHAVIHLSVWKG